MKRSFSIAKKVSVLYNPVRGHTVMHRMMTMVLIMLRVPMQFVFSYRVVWPKMIFVGPDLTSTATVIWIRANRRVMVVMDGLYIMFVMKVLIFVLRRPSMTVADPVPSLNKLK